MRDPELPPPRARRILALGGRAGRAALTGLALLIVLWSFYRVLARPFQQGARTARTELTMLHWGDAEEEQIVRELVATFEREHPDIRVRRINASANYYAKLKTMFASGEPPDVMFLNARDISTYAGLGLLKDVEPLMEADARGNAESAVRVSDFYRTTIDSFRFDGTSTGQGRLYGVPSNFTGLGFYYNKTVFRKAGVAPPTEDWTWKEFEEKCRALGRAGGAKACALELTGDSFRAILKTFGQELFTPDLRELRASDPEVVRVIDRIRGLTLGDSAGGAVMATDPYDSVNSGQGLFILGKTAMFGPTGRWMVPPFRAIRDFEWDFAPMPRGTQRGTILYVAAWCVSERTRHLPESWSLARHLATAAGQEQLARTGLAIPSLRSVATGPTFLDPTKPPASDHLFLKDVEESWPSNWPPNSRFNRRFSDYLQDCLRLGRSTVPQAVAAAQADFAAEMDSPLRGGTFPTVPWGTVWTVVGIFMTIVVVAGVLHMRGGGSAGPLRAGEARAGRLMVSPWVIGFVVFMAGPMALSLLLAFTRWNGLTTLDRAEWVGLLNFRQMFLHDPRFMHALWLTVKYAALGVPFFQGAALLAAVLIHQNAPGTPVFRALWYLPSVLAGAGMAVMWRWVFDGERGLLNAALRPVAPALDGALRALGSVLGFTPARVPPDWLGADAEWAGVPAFVIASLWSIGGSMLIYLAGLNAIPQSLYEAAAIDGAGPLRRFFRITLPMLGPVILFNIIIALIASFQVFTQAYIMTQGGPGDSTRFYVLYLFNQAFESHEMGYASAMAWVLLVIVLILTGLVLWQGRKRVHYGGLRA